jgi:GGDEF domain-containing protein
VPAARNHELTRLPNRRLLLDRFNQPIARAARQHELVALPFLDLDGFKTINDALGLATSIGMALYPVDGKAYEDLLRQSDVAMYWDKARGPAKPSLRCDAVAPGPCS